MELIERAGNMAIFMNVIGVDTYGDLVSLL
jgi:hypothetical protein